MEIVEDYPAPLGADDHVSDDLFLDSDEGHKPGRVILIALGFSLATTLAMAGASEFFDHLDGGRYAGDIILTVLARL